MTVVKKRSGRRGPPTKDERLYMELTNVHKDSIKKAVAIQRELNEFAMDNFSLMKAHARGFISKEKDPETGEMVVELPSGNYRAISELHSLFLKGNDTLDQMSILLEEQIDANTAELEEKGQNKEQGAKPVEGVKGGGAVFNKSAAKVH